MKRKINKKANLTMIKPVSYFIKKKPNYDDLSNYSQESLPLDESEDSEKDLKSREDTNKEMKSTISDKINKSNKFSIIKKDKKRTRKDKEDNIRKKIKRSFHKFLKEQINAKLEKVKSEKLFQQFPQNFLSDITRKTNHEVMQLTYGELFKYTHEQLNNDKKKKGNYYLKKITKPGESKINKNKETLLYLETHPYVSKESGWEKIKNTKYVDLLRDFLDSNEFEQSIKALRQKKEDQNYINAYKFFSKTYIEFFLGYQPKEKNAINNSINNIPNQNLNNIMDDHFVNSQITPQSIKPYPFLMSEEIDLLEYLYSPRIDDLTSENILNFDDYSLIHWQE